ncbi:MAG: hypothetical protein QN157_12390 [Armatimonadota bacterium]|nr:hypothetical protein [Armatimonadota bacterium]
MRTVALTLLVLALALPAWGLGPHVTALPAAAPAAVPADVGSKVAAARAATARYATDLERAKADGYEIITPMIPNMGYHFLNPKIEGFDVTKPPILVYVRGGDAWQLVAVEWVWTTRPATPPIQGARYGSFGAACHYKDGSFVMANVQAKCGHANAKTGAAFNFWHPPLVTLHFWIWYPNPDGLFAEFNPLLTPFNKD